MHRKLDSLRRQVDSALRDVWDGIRSRPGRVGLSFLAIAIGIASLSVLIAVLSGLREKSRQIVQELGVNVVGIFQHGEGGRFATPGLEERHASLLAANLPGSSVTTLRLYAVPTLGTRELLSVVATDDSLISVRQWRLDEGRFLDQWDIANRERNAVVSKSLSKLWNWKVGSIVMLRDVPFKVVGVVSVGGGALDAEWSDPRLMLGDRVVFVPKTVAPFWVTDQQDPGQAIDAIFMRATTSSNFAQLLSRAQRLLSQPDMQVSHISWVTPESLIRRLEKIQNTIGWTAGSVAVLCLILGGTTLMSLMVANVRERITEIGLRRAMGASQWDIATLFILEGCLVTCAAAVAATLGAHLLLLVFGNALPVPLRLGAASVFLPPVVAIILGGVFSYWPAKFAARITPAEALRNE